MLSSEHTEGFRPGASGHSSAGNHVFALVEEEALRQQMMTKGLTSLSSLSRDCFWRPPRAGLLVTPLLLLVDPVGDLNSPTALQKVAARHSGGLVVEFSGRAGEDRSAQLSGSQGSR